MKLKPADWPRMLRSTHWFGARSKDNIHHRSWIKNQGLPDGMFDGRPVIQAPASGYARIFHDLVEGADSGAGFTILKGRRGSAVPRDSH